MRKIVKIGILGCGRVSDHYLKIFKSQKIKNFKIIFACDINLSKAKTFAKKFNAKYDISIENLLLNNEIDLAIILTESGKHYSHAKFFLQNKINVLVEKPAAFFLKQKKELALIAKKNKLMLCVSYQNRLNPSVQYIKRLLNKKKFGRIISSSVKLIWCRYQEYYNDGWHGTWLMDGGVTNQQGIHHVDALSWLLGPVNKVSSFTTKRLNKLEAEDTMVSILEFKNNSLGTIELTTSARPIDYEASISITGEKGFIKIGGIALNKIEQLQFKKNNLNYKNIKRKYSENVKNGYGVSHYRLIQSIIDSLRGKKNQNIVKISDTFETTKLINAIYLSDELSKSVNLKTKILSKRLGKFNARK